MNDETSAEHGHHSRIGRLLHPTRASHTAAGPPADPLNSVDADAFYAEGDDIRDTKAPDVPIADRWDQRRFSAKLVNPANGRKLSVIIVGTGLAGASAAATLGEAGYKVTT